MTSNQLVLSWKDHNGTLVSVFEDLLKKNTFVDCTLAAEGQYLKAHKIVLSACSSYFELLFSQESEKNPIVILKDVEFQDLEAAVNFMYRGEVEIYENRLATFLEVAESLQIKGLGSDRKIQRLGEEKPSVLSEKISSQTSAVSPRQHSRKDALNSPSDSAHDSPNVPVACELVRNNENSAVHQPFQSENSHSAPIILPSSFFNQSGHDTQNDEDNFKNNLSSVTALPQFPLEENEQSDTKPAIKIEPETDTCAEEESEVVDMDFVDDLAKLEDQEDWDEDNGETMSDAHSTSQQDFGFTPEHVMAEDGTSEYPGGFESKNQPSSEGAENVIIPDEVFNQPSTGSSRRFNLSGTTSIYGASAESTNSSIQLQNPQLPESEMHICVKCLKTFSSSAKLKNHMRYHDRNRYHKCSFCDYSTLYSATLTVHLRKHTGERPYKCSYCMHGYKTNSDLTRHIRIHTGVKPYQCPDCDYKSSDGSALVSHRRIHSGEKPFQCRECDYKANQLSHLKKHQHLHSSGKPH